VHADRDNGPLAAFVQHPPETTTVLLVRHGSAGRKQEWSGPDLQRPLDDRGLAQARALATVLPAYGPGRVLSAPALRCRQTVEPLADDLGLSVEVDADLAEQSWEALPARLRALGGEAVHTVACSQGGAIPHGLALAADSGLVLETTSAKKGSVWALSFYAGRLVDADYAADLTI
jgi:8-oxo-dGTP diphosphatase